VDRVYRMFAEHGADVWFERTTAEILPPGAACEKCGNTSFVKEVDILDVWFDSGVSHAAVLEARRTCAGRPISTSRAATSTAAGSTVRS